MQKLPVTERFLQSFDDPTVFDCGKFNLLKVVQDALIRKVSEQNGKVSNTLFNRPDWFIKTYFMVKKFKSKSSSDTTFLNSEFTRRKHLVVIPTRFVSGTEGQKELMYYGRLGDQLPREKVLLMYIQQASFPPVQPDVTLNQIVEKFACVAPGTDEWQLLADLRKCYRNIVKNCRLNREEKHHVKVGLDEFWRNYRVMNQYLQQTAVEKALLIPGYYTEYLIAALKNNGVLVTEIQHGVITPASHFYIYPEKIKPVVRRALFADNIWLFGEFWKKQLLRGIEFDAGQMSILGEYYVRQISPPRDALSWERFCARFSHRVLVGTQTNRHEHFKSFVKQLAEKYMQNRPEAGIVLKPHPAENPELYQTLSELPNVHVTDASLDFLYKHCVAYVSMYSNTLFEATRVPELKRFVLCTDDTRELAEGMADTGIAKMILTQRDPLSINESGESASHDANYYFQKEINTALLDSFLQ